MSKKKTSTLKKDAEKANTAYDAAVQAEADAKIALADASEEDKAAAQETADKAASDVATAKEALDAANTALNDRLEEEKAASEEEDKPEFVVSSKVRSLSCGNKGIKKAGEGISASDIGCEDRFAALVEEGKIEKAK